MVIAIWTWLWPILWQLTSVSIFCMAMATEVFSRRLLRLKQAGILCSVASVDWNDDGHMDIIVAHYGDQDIVALFGDGAGNFTNRIIYDGRLGVVILIATDLKNDGHPDIIAYDIHTTIILLVLRIVLINMTFKILLEWFCHHSLWWSLM